MRRWIIVGAGIIIVFVLFAIFRPFRGRSGTNQSSDFQTVEASRGSLMATVGASGAVEANQDAILTFQTTGTVEHVLHGVGNVVEKGDILVTLEQTSLSSQIILAQADLVTAQNALDALYDTDQALAQAELILAQARDEFDAAEYQRNVLQEGNRASGETIAAAEANLVLAQSEVDRAQDEYSKYSGRPVDDPVRALARSNLAAARQKRDSIQRQLNWYLGFPTEIDQAILDAEVQIASSNLEEAQSEVDRLRSGPDPDDIVTANARIAAAEATLEQAQVTAPFTGTITLIEVKPGDKVESNQPAVHLFDLEPLYVQADISEVDINKVEIGQSVILNFDAVLDKQYEGEVVEVGLTGTPFQGIVNFRVTVELLNPDEAIRPGLTAAVNIIVSEIENVLLVPNRAVRVEDGERVVYVSRSGVPEAVIIELGASSDTFSEVIGGDLLEGDLIILNPPMEFGPEPGGGPRGGFFGG
jgi:HlyD family secretion protein